MRNEHETNGDSTDPDDATIDLAARSAVAQALWVRKRLGLPAVTWEDGRIILIPPEKIEIDETLLAQNGKQTLFVE